MSCSSRGSVAFFGGWGPPGAAETLPPAGRGAALFAALPLTPTGRWAGFRAGWTVAVPACCGLGAGTDAPAGAEPKGREGGRLARSALPVLTVGAGLCTTRTGCSPLVGFAVVSELAFGVRVGVGVGLRGPTFCTAVFKDARGAGPPAGCIVPGCWGTGWGALGACPTAGDERTGGFSRAAGGANCPAGVTCKLRGKACVGFGGKGG